MRARWQAPRRSRLAPLRGRVGLAGAGVVVLRVLLEEQEVEQKGSAHEVGLLVRRGVRREHDVEGVGVGEGRLAAAVPHLGDAADGRVLAAAGWVDVPHDLLARAARAVAEEARLAACGLHRVPVAGLALGGDDGQRVDALATLGRLDLHDVVEALEGVVDLAQVLARGALRVDDGAVEAEARALERPLQSHELRLRRIRREDLHLERARRAAALALQAATLLLGLEDGLPETGRLRDIRSEDLVTVLHLTPAKDLPELKVLRDVDGGHARKHMEA
mmetsp:Transcript_20466/g.72374  ORF Transcript_20466/g.72374 Transcript_20466/m.72374 type:complete len:276 (-) Transcript_20466:59-886(-)